MLATVRPQWGLAKPSHLFPLFGIIGSRLTIERPHMSRYKVVRVRDGREGTVYVQMQFVPHPDGQAPMSAERHTLNGEPVVRLPDGNLQDSANDVWRRVEYQTPATGNEPP